MYFSLNPSQRPICTMLNLLTVRLILCAILKVTHVTIIIFMAMTL